MTYLSKSPYTSEEKAIAKRLLRAADDEGTIQPGDMLRIAPHNRPELHTTMCVSLAFLALTRKAYDPEILA